MVTTAARSRDYMRKHGFIAEVVEHRRGSFIREDLFGFADVMAYSPESGIVLIQAYHKSSADKHADLYPDRNEKILKFLHSGGRFLHHIWTFKVKNKRKYWSVEEMEVIHK